MGRVRREAASLTESVLQPREHAVQGVGEPVQLVSAAAPLDAPAQVLGGDAAGGARHLVDRAQRDPRDDRPAQRGQPHAERDQHHQSVEVAVAHRERAPERHAHLDHLGDAALAHHRQGEQTHRLGARQHHRLDGGLAARGPRARLRRQRQHVLLAARARPVGMALGIEQPEELVVELGPQQLAQQRVGFARDVGGAGVLDDLGHRQQRGVQILVEAPAQPRVGDRADRDEDREEDRAVPEGEGGAKGQPQARAGHGAALSM